MHISNPEVTKRRISGINSARIMCNQGDLTPVARLDFVGKGSHAPGWYVRYRIDGHMVSERLPIEIGADAFGAAALAAARLGCGADQIAVGGPVWPEPLDGHVDADETLVFVSDQSPSLSDPDGEWRLLSEPGHQHDGVARRFPRREVNGVSLHLPAPGRIMNWSEHGMGVEICRPLRVLSTTQFEAQGKRSRIELFGEVRWCRIVEGLPLKSEARYRAGIALFG